MRRRKWIIAFTFLFLCMTWLPAVSYASQNFKATLIQPAVYKAKAGDKLSYRFKVELPDNYWSKYRSMTATIMLDSKLKPVNQELSGISIAQNDYSISETTMPDGKSLINLSLYNLSKLNRVGRFEMIIHTEIKQGQSDVSRLENSYVMSYRTLDGKDSSYQENVLIRTIYLT